MYLYVSSIHNKPYIYKIVLIWTIIIQLTLLKCSSVPQGIVSRFLIYWLLFYYLTKLLTFSQTFHAAYSSGHQNQESSSALSLCDHDLCPLSWPHLGSCTMTLTRAIGPVHTRGTERWPGQNPPPPFHIESSTDTGKIVLRRLDGQQLTHQIYCTLNSYLWFV